MKIVFLSLLLFSISTFAQDKTFRTESGEYLWLYSEDKTWVLKSFEIRAGKLPIPLETKYFDSEKSALRFATESHRSIIQLSEREIQKISTVETEVRGLSLWNVEHQWSWEWEQKYANWVLAHSDYNFLFNHGIATDCADAVLSYRWIFARIHKLPAAQNAYFVGGVFSQDSIKKEWAKIPTHEDWEKDERFFAALNYLHEVTNTTTLLKDSYPIDLVREAFIPGFHYVRAIPGGLMGHSMISTGINKEERLRFVSSTVPREVRILEEAFYDDPDLPKIGEGTLMRISWPYKKGNDWKLTAQEMMPYYSLAQYSEELLNNELESAIVGIHNKLNLKYSLTDMYKNGVNSLYFKFWDRTFIVNKALEVCSVEDCSPGTLKYEEHSTPSRDKKIEKIWTQLKNIRIKDPENEEFYKSTWDIYSEYVFYLNDDANGPVLSLQKAVNIWEEHKYSSDPRDSLEKRWGIEQ